MGCGQSETRIAQPPVGGRLDGSTSQSMVAGITVGEGFWLRYFSFLLATCCS